MKTRNKIRLGSFIAAAILILGGFAIRNYFMLEQSKTELEYTYRRALNDLSNSIDDMEFTLKKASYANTPTLRHELSAQLLEQSSGAKTSMSVLPFSAEKTEKISRFVSQIGDYSMSLSRKAAANIEISEEEVQSLVTMRDYTVKLRDALQEIQAHLSAEKAAVGKTKQLLNNVDEIDNLPSFDDSLDEIAKEFNEFPTMLYDGPFSDHILQKTAMFLEGKAEISKEEAAKKAAAFLKCDVSELQDGGTQDNTLASYVFNYNNDRILITKLGGEISYFTRDSDIKERKLDYDQAMASALEFLKSQGIETVKESYYVLNDNRCTINFAYTAEGENTVICYPDLLKVSVNLDDGSIVEYDPIGYLMNHHDREFPAPALTPEQAQEKVSSLLTVESYNLAIIPTAGLNEIFAYEFVCKDDEGTDILIYVNAETGMEEQLFILTYSDNGVLAV
ncbi:PepSY1/2 domain-containing protein [Scatolibacter rhodanostii]|uniref:PepSY1/2 domain-containing protein n=1 Tax=Scatolibacter rhodanostii TaxID=2014781 RepID=UPI00135645AF|nr:PepSY1/2 domain-containing protein [Scatolibacter rhodanostii]